MPADCSKVDPRMITDIAALHFVLKVAKTDENLHEKGRVCIGRFEVRGDYAASCSIMQVRRSRIIKER